MGDMDDFVLSPWNVDWIFRQVRASAWVHWGEDFDLTYNVKEGIESKSYYRDGNWTDTGDTDFWERGGLPGLSTPTRPAFWNDKVRSVNVAGIVATTPGAWFTFELGEEEDTPARAELVRIPTASGLMDEVKEWVNEQEDGNVVHIGSIRVEERFSEVIDHEPDPMVAMSLNDVHASWAGMETEAEFKEKFEQIMDFTERSVRSVM